MFRGLKDLLLGKRPRGTPPRSRLWRRVRTEHLTKNPSCAACGGRRKLEVHHLIPFHLAPELELEPSNLLTLCERKRLGVNCHLFFGHLGNYRTLNFAARHDAGLFLARLGDVLRQGKL